MLEHLHTLNLAENNIGKIVSLPRGIRRLNLSGNELTAIPDAVGACEHIQILRLSRNRISDLSEILKLEGRFNLHSLNMSQNPVATLPQYFSFCICVCRGLDILDGSSVTEGTRQAALQRYGGELQSELTSGGKRALRRGAEQSREQERRAEGSSGEQRGGEHGCRKEQSTGEGKRRARGKERAEGRKPGIRNEATTCTHGRLSAPSLTILDMKRTPEQNIL